MPRPESGALIPPHRQSAGIAPATNIALTIGVEILAAGVQHAGHNFGTRLRSQLHHNQFRRVARRQVRSRTSRFFEQRGQTAADGGAFYHAKSGAAGGLQLRFVSFFLDVAHRLSQQQACSRPRDSRSFCEK